LSIRYRSGAIRARNENITQVSTNINQFLKFIDGPPQTINKNIMKILLSFTICTFFVVSTSCKQQVQNNEFKKETETFIFDYYTKHFYLLENTPITIDFPSDAFYVRLDSLMSNYCTLRLRNEAKEVFEKTGADILTNNLGSVDLNEKLKVERHAVKENNFVVSFIATYLDSPGGAIKKRVALNVTVELEDGVYRIDSINKT
jgi:hypothetical protein